MKYVPRIIDKELKEKLAAVGAVVIEGPRACGKTETARKIAASEVLLDVDKDARTLAEIDPAQALVGATPRLIDEWQLEPSIWNHVRRAIDDDRPPASLSSPGPQRLLTTSRGTRAPDALPACACAPSLSSKPGIPLA